MSGVIKAIDGFLDPASRLELAQLVTVLSATA